MNASGRNWKARKTVTGEHCGAWGPFSAEPGTPGSRERRDGYLSWLFPRVVEFKSPRASAFALLGLQEYLESFPGDRAALNAADALANRLLDLYVANSSVDWKWFENVLAYSNARLPQALIRAGTRSSNDAMVSAGLEALDWLARIQRCEIKGHFVPIGSHGFYSKKTEKARFDQQPIEACSAVSAYLQAYRATGKGRWRKEAWTAFNWFLGDNDLQIALYDPTTGGCRDGLHPDRPNENQGAGVDAVFPDGTPGNAQVGRSGHDRSQILSSPKLAVE